jgi:carbamoyl-phosphate synthase large subunit
MKNVLILSAGRRVELVESFLKEINLKNHDIKLFTTDMKPNYSAACKRIENNFQSIEVGDPNYIDFILKKSKVYDIGMIIPTIDTELLILSKNLELFKSNGVNIVVSNPDLIKVSNDKRLTFDFFNNLNLDVPIIYKKDKLKFPCFAKPYSGSSSIGCLKILDKDDLSVTLINDDKIIFTEFVGNEFSEYTVDMYYDQLGELKCLVPRQRIEVRAGEVSKGITRKNYVYDYLLSHFKKLSGARGCITLQLFYNNKSNKIYFIEINPRFGGGFPLSYSAKANYPGWLLDEYFYNRKITFFDSWEKNLLMLRYDSKMLIHNVS